MLTRQSVFYFQDICKYMKGELKEDLACLAIRGILSYGIERVELRDEIYCQLIRQTNGCRHVEHTLRAWVIMGLAAVSFSPSRTLLKVRGLGFFKKLERRDRVLLGFWFSKEDG